MEPVFGLALFLAVTSVSTVVAVKRRGRDGWYAIAYCLVGGFVLVKLISAAGGGGIAAGFGAFLAPAGVLFWALATRTSEQLAVERGSHGDYKKCPFCAESVRREAIKCKHCGSELVRGAPPLEN
jgi:hypothetical protein